jgi:hypothetical protein
MCKPSCDGKNVYDPNAACCANKKPLQGGVVGKDGKCGCANGTVQVGTQCKPACGNKAYDPKSECCSGTTILKNHAKIATGECRPLCGSTVYDPDSACCSAKKIFLGQFPIVGGKCSIVPAEAAAAMRLMAKSAEGAKITKFITDKKVGFQYAVLPTGTKARFDKGKILIPKDSAQKPPVELAVDLSHEGYHAMHSNVLKSIEDEQDAKFVEFMVYHEMLRVRVTKLPNSNLLEKQYLDFKTIMRGVMPEQALALFNLAVSAIYGADPGYATLEDLEKSSKADPIKVRDSKVLHKSQQALAKTWINKHKTEF